MDFILDASVTMPWLIETQCCDYCEAVLTSFSDGNKATVPHIWQIEIANVLLVMERREKISHLDSTRFTTGLLSLPITVKNIDSLETFNNVLHMGREYALSSYDACYLALAAKLELPLATRDRKLIASASKCHIAIFQPS